jgi:hypothetical protein
VPTSLLAQQVAGALFMCPIRRSSVDSQTPIGTSLRALVVTRRDTLFPVIIIVASLAVRGLGKVRCSDDARKTT